MRFIIYILLCVVSNGYADTIDRYMSIANNIPQMQMKAEPEAQAWARSARDVLLLASDAIVDSLVLANTHAAEHGSPLFCLPPGVTLSSMQLNDLIQQTYHGMDSQKDRDKLTVSQVALIGLGKQYPCMGQAKA